MKILEIVFSLAPGGAERFVVDLSNELSKSNDVTLMTLKDEKIDSENRLFYRFDVSNRVRYVNLGLKDGFKISSLWKIYKAIANFKPDVVHMHGSNCPAFCVLAITLLCNKIKFYQTIHSDMSRYDNYFYRIFFRTFGRFKKVHFAALSETNYLDLIQRYPHADARCIVNGRAPIVATDKFDKVKSEIDVYRKSKQTIIALHVARFNQAKNQQLLVNSFNELTIKGFDVQLIIIGAGFDSKNGKELLSKARGNIHYIGTRKNISDYMLNADLFVLSSSYEGMPITLLEASLAGIPCVSTPVCGAVDLIKDSYNGKLSKDFSQGEYVQALTYAIENNKFLKDYAIQMKDSSPFTMEICANKYTRYFNEN